MNNDLLKEFFITKLYNIYVITASDKAYELLGLENKTIDSNIDKTKGSIPDYYCMVVFLNFLKNNYNINGLVRSSKGNAHDAYFEKEVCIFNGGGVFKEALDKYKTMKLGPYYSTPTIINYDDITEEIIEKWAEEYDLSGDGEDGRFIYCSNSNGVKDVYEVMRSKSVGTAADQEYVYRSIDFPSNYNLCRIFFRRS